MIVVGAFLVFTPCFIIMLLSVLQLRDETSDLVLPQIIPK